MNLSDNRVLGIALTALCIIATIAVATTMQGDDSPSGLAYKLATATIAIGLLVVVDRTYFRSVNFTQEIANGNVAAAIVYGSLAVLIGLCVSAI